MLNILIVVLGLGILVGLHELAHMLTAKAFGVRVLKFSFGFGTRLFSRTVGDTSYELRLLPLGGFVQFAGEDPGTNVKGGFFALPWYKRALIALAGPVTNILLGAAIVFVLLLFKDWPVLEALKKTFELCSLIFTGTLQWIGGLFTSKSHVSDMSGPVMVTKIMASSLKESFAQFLLILSIVSLSMGLFNLFPIPGLDGGHVALYTVEGLRGKPLSEKIYDIWSKIGFILLIALMIFVIGVDISKLYH